MKINENKKKLVPNYLFADVARKTSEFAKAHPDREIIRLGIPPLTEERRRELTKQCSREAEAAKVSIRNARRDAIEKLKKCVKNGVSEDVAKDGEEKCQKIHDKYIKKVDAMLEAKNKEIMTV